MSLTQREAEELALQTGSKCVGLTQSVAVASDQQYYKQAGKQTLTLRMFFKIVWG